MARVRGFGELEASIMDRLWNRDPEAGTTVRDIFDELSTERHIAYTTVMSTMDNLHGKGWLSRERDGKAYRYRPTLTREEHSARLMLEALSGGGRSEVAGATSSTSGGGQSGRLWMISSTLTLASPKSIRLFSRKKSGFWTPA